MVTFGVILITLLGQGLTLPAVLRWASYSEDTRADEERLLAERRAAETALDALPDLARELDSPGLVVDRVRAELEQHLRTIDRASVEDDAEPVRSEDDAEAALRLSLLATRRDAVLRLRDDRVIDDLLLLQVQKSLDVEEIRLSSPSAPD